ncbi:tetrathionate reductase subunit A [Wohlfahrtiimonas chitiniclastica]|uniref:molybdopterin-dependent oxidoreductase n=1 Tax=Wohlfahrtiimonas chitiniclastica TaxID=400946 RepID=UPI000B98E380|nr:molybdopterin-dependent oxidoreductase [Wohlfahrtiimonas chitiniclastica]OYQ78979.1 tetrathionate reductase subunit A [Wohlfahrtiimonas chitiniclastica]
MDKTNKKRRNLLKGLAAAGGVGAFIAGYSNTAKNMAVGMIKGTSAEPTDNRIFGNALTVEGVIKDGHFTQTPGQVMSNTQCFGCWTVCGVRVRVDQAKNEVLRICGNPYSPLSHDEHYPYDLPIEEAWVRLGGETGINDRSTACARGAAMGEGLTSPYRVLSPLKRVGKRGEGKWQRISFEQLVKEVVEGGDLFGEGHVEGLRAIRDLETPIDANFPEYGPKANQLLVTDAGNEGREELAKRFTFNSFGSKNFAQHGSYCGLAYRLGSGAVMDDMQKNAHAKPDFDHIEFALFMGTSPAQSGNPFKRQGRLLAKARTKTPEEFSYVVIAPNLQLTNTLAVDDNRWIPILPGTDSAMAMALMRVIIDEQWYNATYLKTPGKAGMAHHQEVSVSNATHLVISDESHPLYGQFLREWDITEMDGARSDSALMVMDEASHTLMKADDCLTGSLYIEEPVRLKDGTAPLVKSSMTLLTESAHRHSLEEYSNLCGVPVATIKTLAKKFTSHGRKAAVITHGGMMSGNGFYNAWSIMALNVLIGNMNHKGGLLVNGGKFKEYAPGPRYNLVNFKGMVQPKGMLLARAKKPYETSTDYKALVKAGKNPYPAKRPWYPFAGGQSSEVLISALAQDPYPLKAWISHMTNPVYGIAGFRQLLGKQLADPKVLPLFVAVDAFINETTAFADYIVPDTHNFESWGFTAPWGGVPFKATTARWPVVEPRVEKTAQDDPICMESFFIAIGERMNLPGFGDEAIQDAKDPTIHYPFKHPEDYYLRAAANVAFDDAPVNNATESDLVLTGVTRILPKIQAVLKPEEQAKVAYVYARGGRTNHFDTGWDGDHLRKKWPMTMQLWNENVSVHTHSTNGERYSGCPTYYPARFMDGSDMRTHYHKDQWPFLLTSFKSNLISSTAGSNLRMRMIKPTNIVAISQVDADLLDINNGDLVFIESPSGKKEAQIMVLDGVMPGVIAIEHGYGHRDMGARAHYIDGEPLYFNRHVGSGLNLNDLAIQDPSRAIPAPWLDWATGAVVRQGIPARITKA